MTAVRSIPSPNHGGLRGPVRWIILHTAEGARDVTALGTYFANPSAQASSHVGIDDHDIAQYVPYDQTAWTALAANPYADQAELCGFANWDRATWLTHPGMLEQTAAWVADRCHARGIPCTRITPAQVAARQPGVIGHKDVTDGLYGGVGHYDPGPGFPWDIVLTRATEILQGDDMPTAAEIAQAVWDYPVNRGGQPVRAIQELADAKTLALEAPDRIWRATTVARGSEGAVPVIQELADAKTQALAAVAELAALRTALASLSAGQPVDLAAVQAAARAGAAQALAGGVTVTVDVPGATKP